MRTSRLGQLLVEEGLLSEKDRRTIKRNCGYTGGAFAKSVISLGLMDEVELASFLAEKTNTEIASKNLSADAQPGAIGAVDLPLLEKLEVIPLELRADILKVAMIDPLDMDTIAQLEFFTNYKIVPIVATQTQIHQALSELLRGYKPGLTNLEEFLHNHATTASKRLKIIQGATIGDTPVPVKPFKETSAPPVTNIHDKPFRFKSAESSFGESADEELNEDAIEDIDEQNEDLSVEDFDDGDLEFGDSEAQEFNDDLDSSAIDRSPDDEFDDLVNEDAVSEIAKTEPSQAAETAENSSNNISASESSDPIADEFDIENDIDRDTEGDTHNAAMQSSSDELDALDDLDQLDPIENSDSSEEIAILTKQTLTSSDGDTDKGDTKEAVNDSATNTAIAELEDFEDLDDALAATSKDPERLSDDIPTPNDNPTEDLAGLTDLTTDDESTTTLAADSSLPEDIEINPSSAVDTMDANDTAANLQNSNSNEALDEFMAEESPTDETNHEVSGSNIEMQESESIMDEEIDDDAPLIGDDDEHNQDFDDEALPEDLPLESSSQATHSTPALTEKEQVNLRKLSMSAVGRVNKALMKLGMLSDRDEIINEVAIALYDAGIKKLLLIENGEVLTPLMSWEFTEESLVVKEQGLELYVTEGLNHAFARLFAGWTTFDDATREENLEPFKSWTVSGEVLAASMIACGDVKVIAVVAWADPYCDSEAIRASSLDLVKRLIKKI